MTTRPLTGPERQVIEHLLAVPFEGVEQLRAQVAQAEVRGGDAAGLQLEVPLSAPSSPRRDGPVPVTAAVYDPSGTYLGELLLWVSRGVLSLLEYAWVTDAPPTELPPVAAIRVAPRR